MMPHAVAARRAAAALRGAALCLSAARRAAALPHARSLSAAADDSHSDFKPKTKVSPNDPAALKAQIDEVTGAAARRRQQARPALRAAAAAARCAPRCFDAAAAAPRWVGTSTRRRRRAAAPCARLQLVTKHKVVLFMKGTPSQPMCGFSAQTVRLLHQHGA